MFIGRHYEMQMLQKQYDAHSGSLVILYGRRRVGKTELLREFVREKNVMFYACTETTDAEQLASFGRMILHAGHPAAQYTASFPDWETAFLAMSEVPGEGKTIVVIDEFPYMARENKEIPSILQNMWDHTLQYKNVMLILSGSSLSFMEKEVLSDKRPLYGRATCIIRLQPLNYLEAAAFFPKWSPEDKLRTYAILGGIPHYLKQFDPALSLRKNIIEKLLTNGAALYNEVGFMIRQEFREPGTYRAILGAIATGATKLNEISEKTHIEANKLSTYLSNLMEAGMVERKYSVTREEKEEGNAKRGRYQLYDPYFRFWFSFVRPCLGELDMGDSEGICDHIIMPRLDFFSSMPFEKVAIQYLRIHKTELPFYFIRIGRWWTKESELDIVALSADGSAFLGGECKYRNSPVTIGDVQHAMSKLPREMEGKTTWCFFSKGGYTEEVKALLGKYAFTLDELYLQDS